MFPSNRQQKSIANPLCSVSFWVSFLTLVLLSSTAESKSLFGGGGRRLPVASIFGKPEDRAKETVGSAEGPAKPIIPPPPPPPPMAAKTRIPPPPPPKPNSQMATSVSAAVKEEKKEDILVSPVAVEDTPEDSTPEVSVNPQEPASTTDSWSIDNNPQYPPPQEEQQQHEEYHVQPQPYYYGYDDQQQQDPYSASAWPPMMMSLEQQLAESRAREQDLLTQIHNLTETNQYVQQQDQIHLRQMDVLTERIMEAEAQMARENTMAIEYQANCTELGRQMAVLQQELADWQSRCANFADQHAASQTKIKQLKKNLDEARAEAENLAISIENARIRDQMDLGLKKKKKKKNKQSSMLGWIWSFFWSSSSDQSEVDDDDYQTPQELAKSTLLRALQIERDNIDELEGAMASLQSNNSAIAEMVKSRDLVIDELNDRVAVFEEDKVVLKAALKQLQKEMKEEAPKTQRLIDDLEAARQDNARLAAEIESLVEMHQGEITALQVTIAEAQNAANASESNLTAIGQYVDTLEQRLASFAIIRRDVELREQKCKEVEEHVQQVEEERDNLQTKIEEFEVEQSDLKALFEELVQEQTSLREEKAELIKERDALLEGAQRSREALASLEVNMKQRDQDIEEWKSKAEQVMAELNSTKKESDEIQKGMQVARAGNDELKSQIDTAKSFSDELQSKLDSKTAEVTAMKEQLEVTASELKKNDKELSSRAAELKKICEQLEERDEKLKAQGEELLKLKEEIANKPKPVSSEAKHVPEKVKPELEEARAELEEEVSTPEVPTPQSSANVSIANGPGNTTSALNSTVPEQNKTRSSSKPATSNSGKQSPARPNAGIPKAKKRNVPLRGVRKFFARATGIHGAFTPPSTRKEAPKRVARPKDVKRGPPPKGAAKQQGLPPRGPPPKRTQPPKGSEKSRQPPPRRPGSLPPRRPQPPINPQTDAEGNAGGAPPLPKRSFGKPPPQQR